MSERIECVEQLREQCQQANLFRSAMEQGTIVPVSLASYTANAILHTIDVLTRERDELRKACAKPVTLKRMAITLPEDGEPKFFDVPEEVVEEMDRRTRKSMKLWRAVKQLEKERDELKAANGWLREAVEHLFSERENCPERIDSDTWHLLQSALAATASGKGEK